MAIAFGESRENGPFLRFFDGIRQRAGDGFGRGSGVSGEIFDVDLHVIYPSPTDIRHEHFDIRFLLEMDDDVPLLGSDESHDVLWVPLDEVSRYNNDRSSYRMVQKTYRLAPGSSAIPLVSVGRSSDRRFRHWRLATRLDHNSAPCVSARLDVASLRGRRAGWAGPTR